jgi:hypothetical protein
VSLRAHLRHSVFGREVSSEFLRFERDIITLPTAIVAEMSMKQVVYSIASLLVIVAAILLLWVILWKFVLEPNPLVRDFFDLDLKDKSKKKT